MVYEVLILVPLLISQDYCWPRQNVRSFAKSTSKLLGSTLPGNGNQGVRSNIRDLTVAVRWLPATYSTVAAR